MKLLLSALVLLSLGGTPTASAAIKSNVMLSYTMKAIGRDLALVVDPTKKPVGEANDNIVLTAVIRGRMISGLMQQAIDKREGELMPGKLDETTDPEEHKKLSNTYAGMLANAQKILAQLEVQYFAELEKADVKARDFTAAAATIKQLEGAIGQAHSMFKPPKPPMP